MQQLSLPFQSRSLSWVTALAFLSIVFSIFFYSPIERTGGWTAQCLPYYHPYDLTSVGCDGNPILGYSYLNGKTLIQRENVPFITQVRLFLGEKSIHKFFYKTRVLNSFVASFFAPYVGILSSLVLVNFIAWLLCGWITWRFTLRYFQDPLAALVATVLTATGTGFILHYGDYSAHFISYVTYYLGVLLIFETEVWKRKRELKTHLVLGAYFGIAMLGYNNAPMFILAYLLVSIRHNRILHLGGALVLALSASPLWLFLLKKFNIEAEGYDEAVIGQAIYFWRPILNFWFNGTFSTSLKFLFDGTAFESPWVLIAGITGWVTAKKSRDFSWFLLCTLLIPFFSLLLFASYVNINGFLVYGVTLLLFAGCGGLFARGWRTGGVARAITVGLGVFLLFQHVSWSTALFRGNPGAALAFNTGWSESLRALKRPPVVVSLTGDEPTPRIFGGIYASQTPSLLKDAGLVGLPEELPVRDQSFSFNRSFKYKAVFWLYAVILFFLTLPSLPWKVGAVSGLTLLFIWHSYPLKPESLKVPHIVDLESAFIIDKGQTLEYTVSLSPLFLANLAHNEPSDHLEFWVNAPDTDHFDPASFALYAGEKHLNLFGGPYSRWVASSSEIPAILEAKRLQMKIIVPMKKAISIGGWQQNGLPHRSIKVYSRHGDLIKTPWPRLPAFEVRLVKRDGFTPLIGF